MSSPRPVVPAVNGWSAEYLDRQYSLYQSDPNAVSADLRAFFLGYELAHAPELKTLANKNLGASGPPTPAPQARFADQSTPQITPGRGQPAGRASHFQAVVDDLITAYRDHGHLAAQIDPFGRPRETPESLEMEYHHLTDDDLDRRVDASRLGMAGEHTLREVIDRLRETYCSSIGVEFLHIQDAEQRAWLFERFENNGGKVELSRGQRAHILELLTQSEMFEKFLGKRYPGEKRFSLEGAESLIPLLSQLLESSTDLGVEEIVLGMAHRGRLNVLNNILGKTYEQIFTEFEESWVENFDEGGGDVKYHRGYSGTRRFPNGRMLHLAMASNPSHLEAVDPVVHGRCRAKQRLRGDTERNRAIPVLIHGDAAIAGQGIVAETLNYSQLEGYTTGGTVHVVVNNQIGFTTIPEDGRSSRYCTDIGKAIDAPIFHVNGNDPEAVAACARFAIEYRQEFKRDVFIDLWCYRKYGHNEQDEASFTQPLLSALIKKQPSTLTVYADRLLDEGVINEADVQAIRYRLDEALEQAQKAAQSTPNDPTIDPGSARWAGVQDEYSFDPVDTAVDKSKLAKVCKALGSVPDGFKVNRKLKPLLKSRSELLETREISYADAESLAYGTLLLEGHPVRLSGQDCRRGTFSHRHAVLRDTETGDPHTPLNSMAEIVEAGGFREGTQARFCVYDSPLSEYSVLGFEYGYSLADPNMLVIWEAQFGDFVNGAQVIIDQFLASAEAKWERWSGLTMLLPHGYEGAGPEHSSARMERFLKLCGNNNMEVVYPSTAAQTFHMFRRSMKRPFRKPLIVMTPKSRIRTASSTIDELMDGRFHELLDDPMFAQEGADRSKVTRVIICCGKVYFDLDERRRELGRTDIAMLRVEQIHPFHVELFNELNGAYPADAQRVYVQEETRNAAAYGFVADQLRRYCGLSNLPFIGRESSGTPAVGSKRMHKVEQEQIIRLAVGAPADDQGGAGKAQVGTVESDIEPMPPAKNNTSAAVSA